MTSISLGTSDTIEIQFHKLGHLKRLPRKGHSFANRGTQLRALLEKEQILELLHRKLNGIKM